MCYHGWDEVDANVVCQQLGFSLQQSYGNDVDQCTASMLCHVESSSYDRLEQTVSSSF